jgi:uncharacterized protein
VSERALKLKTSRGPVPSRFGAPEDATATLVVGHGAGSGMGSLVVTGFCAAARNLGLATLRFDFPYMAEGRKAPDRPPILIETYRAAFEAASRRGPGPVLACGKSMGGRIGSMAVAEGMPADALAFLGYPLHPPGAPEKIRDAHLYEIAAPMLFLQGTRDTFARPDLLHSVVERLGARATLVEFEGADHSFRVPGGPRDGSAIGASLAPYVAAFAGGD